MSNVIVRYVGNGSVRCNGKSTSKLYQGTGATGGLQIGEAVIIKTKSYLWKAIVVNLYTTSKAG